MRGNVRRRAKGTWTLTVDIGPDPVTGKRRQTYRTVKGTKKDAEAALAELVRSVETGLDFDSSRLTVGEYLEKWLDASSKRVKQRTFARYSELLRLHVLPIVGSLPLAKLKPLHLEKVYSSAEDKGLSKQSVLHIHRVAYTALRQAVRWQLVGRNVAEAVIPPRPDRRNLAALEPADVRELFEAVAGTHLETPTILAVGTGMRLGEVLGLRWRHVNLKKAELRITQTLQITMDFDTPKTHRSMRTVTLPKFAVAALRRHKKDQNERRLSLGESWTEMDLVIDDGSGGPMRPAVVSRQFRATTRKAGLDLTFHGLRHGHASLMLAAGEHLKVVSEQLGHSTIGITGDLYTHVAPVVRQKAAHKLDTLIASFIQLRG
jgi:integrase